MMWGLQAPAKTHGGREKHTMAAWRYMAKTLRSCALRVSVIMHRIDYEQRCSSCCREENQPPLFDLHPLSHTWSMTQSARVKAKQIFPWGAAKRGDFQWPASGDPSLVSVAALRLGWELLRHAALLVIITGSVMKVKQCLLQLQHVRHFSHA